MIFVVNFYGVVWIPQLAKGWPIPGGDLIAIKNQCVGLRLTQADVSLIKNLTLNSVTQTRRGVRGAELNQLVNQ